MKKVFVISLILMIALSNNAISQIKLKKKVIKDKEFAIEEIFFVQNSNKTIRHGEYKKYYKGKLIEEGIYHN